jgi:hypothetical protein
MNAFSLLPGSINEVGSWMVRCVDGVFAREDKTRQDMQVWDGLCSRRIDSPFAYILLSISA